jgi:adenylate cyclase
VRYIVRGSLRGVSGDVRLTTELVDSNSSLVLGSCIVTITDKFSFSDQDRLVAQTVNALAPRVGEKELERIRGKRPSSLSAYEKILLARLQMRTVDNSDFKGALTLLDEAIVEEPTFAEAYSLLADWYGLAAAERISDRKEYILKSEALAKNALRYDPCNVRALTFYAHRRSLFHRDFETSCSLFERALTTAPNSALVLRWSSLTYAFLGEADEAINRAERALSLSPRDIDAHSFYMAIVAAYYTAGKFDIAADYSQLAMSAYPILPSSGGWAAASLAAAGRLSEARAIALDTMAAQPARRVRDIIDRHPYSDPKMRQLYGRHLLAAGFPE